MTVIKAITYAESREEFFAKKLKQAERALDNVVKYGTDPDACAEKGEIVSFYRDALEALRAQAERSKSVPLKDVYRVIAGHSDYHGNAILSALTCIAEGKSVEPIKPLKGGE